MSSEDVRLDRLEKKAGGTGRKKKNARCQVCKDRPDHQIITLRNDGPEPDLACPGCGWEPDVVVFHERIISTREQWRAVKATTPGPDVTRLGSV